MKFSVFILFKYITNSKFRICIKELFVQQFDPLDVSYAVLAGKSISLKIILLEGVVNFQLTKMPIALLATTKTNENSNKNNRNTNTKQGQPALKINPAIKTVLLRTKTITTTENRVKKANSKQ